MKPLVIIPVFIHKQDHIQLLMRCLASLRDPAKTATEVDIILVDDCSPYPEKSAVLKQLAAQYSCELVEKKSNTGFSKTVNVGLMKAHSENRVAVLVNMDMEFSPQSFPCPNWLQEALDDPADLVGARLLYPTGLVQHGGVFYSLIHRYLDHLFRFAPPDMPEANVRANVPVTGALHIIKPQVMDAIGYYDENFKMAYEDIDYCLRVMLPLNQGGAGMEVAYNPKVCAMHHESMIRGGQKKYSQWHDESWMYFQTKYARTPMQDLIPAVDRRR